MMVSVLYFLVVLTAMIEVAAATLRCPNVAFVVHSNNHNDHVTTFMSETFLYNTNLVIVTGHDTFDSVVEHRRRRQRKLNLRKVLYDGNPGGLDTTFRTGGRKYLGTHRTMAGILMAMDLYPSADWVYVLDDDNVINVEEICATLSSMNASVPLLLGQVGMSLHTIIWLPVTVTYCDVLHCVLLHPDLLNVLILTLPHSLNNYRSPGGGARSLQRDL
jgi:hypothetical protein